MVGHLLRSKKKVDASTSQKSWNGKDRFGVLNFLDSFRRACNDGGVQEGVGMMLFQYYVKDTAWVTLKDRIESPASSPTDRAQQRKAKNLKSWSLIVQRLLKKYATDQDIAEANSRVCAWRIPDGMNERTFTEQLQERARKYGDVYTDRMLLEFFALQKFKTTCASTCVITRARK